MIEVYGKLRRPPGCKRAITALKPLDIKNHLHLLIASSLLFDKHYLSNA